MGALGLALVAPAPTGFAYLGNLIVAVAALSLDLPNNEPLMADIRDGLAERHQQPPALLTKDEALPLLPDR